MASALNHQCRIFQEESIAETIVDVLKGAGFQSDDCSISLRGRYEPLTKPPRESCVEHSENYSNFISRLMEEEGISYFFEYAGNKEVLVIADADSIHEATAPQNEVRYEEPTGCRP